MAFCFPSCFGTSTILLWLWVHANGCWSGDIWRGDWLNILRLFNGLKVVLNRYTIRSFCSRAALKLLSDYFTSFPYTRSLKPRLELFAFANKQTCSSLNSTTPNICSFEKASVMLSVDVEAGEFWCSEDVGYWRCLLALSVIRFASTGSLIFLTVLSLTFMIDPMVPFDFPLYVPCLSWCLLRVLCLLWFLYTITVLDSALVSNRSWRLPRCMISVIRVCLLITVHYGVSSLVIVF